MVPSRGGAGIQLAVLSGTPRHAPLMSCMGTAGAGEVALKRSWWNSLLVGSHQ